MSKPNSKTLSNKTRVISPQIIRSSSVAPTKGKKRKASIRKGGDGCPIFIRKTYQMIDTCNQNIACWGDDEETSFLVKDPDGFASLVIPQFFKHSNFASFVRQLNFYGFRKIKFDPIRINKNEGELPESKYWRFRHDKFLKGRPDLLLEITKANQEPMQKQDKVDDIKKEMKTLRESILSLNSSIEQMQNLISKITLSGSLAEEKNSSHGAHVTSDPFGMTSDLIDFSNVPDQELFLEQEPKANGDHGLGSDLFSFLPGVVDSSNNALVSVSTQELMDCPEFPDIDQENISFCDKTANANDEDKSAPMKEALFKRLAILPYDVQEQIVNDLEGTVAHPAFINDHVDAAFALAQISANLVSQNAKKINEDNLSIPSSEEEPPEDVTMQLVSTVLAAFLTQEGSKNLATPLPSKERHTVVPIHA